MEKSTYDTFLCPLFSKGKRTQFQFVIGSNQQDKQEREIYQSSQT